MILIEQNVRLIFERARERERGRDREKVCVGIVRDERL